MLVLDKDYWQTSPLQLCLMTAQVANGGYEIKPRIILDEEEKITLRFRSVYR